jgi:ubiquinone/menaquinone biosynthesis C-methylase UbiE
VFDPEEYREKSGAAWDRIAVGWSAHADSFQLAALPVSQWMVDAASPQVGQTLVELAAGTGDTGFLALSRAQPGGRLLCTDGSQGMLDAAAERARKLGIPQEQVQFRLMQAEWLDLSAATVDVILCRWGYMLLADPEAALRETRRVLRPDGRVVLAAWTAPEDNPWMSTMNDVLAERGLSSPSDASQPGPYSMASSGRIHELLTGAGFQEIRVETVSFAFTAPDLDSWWEQRRHSSPALADAVRGLSPAEHYSLREAVDNAYAPYLQPDGAVLLPARSWVAVAVA